MVNWFGYFCWIWHEKKSKQQTCLWRFSPAQHVLGQPCWILLMHYGFTKLLCNIMVDKQLTALTDFDFILWCDTLGNVIHIAITVLHLRYRNIPVYHEYRAPLRFSKSRFENLNYWPVAGTRPMTADLFPVLHPLIQVAYRDTPTGCENLAVTSLEIDQSHGWDL